MGLFGRKKVLKNKFYIGQKICCIHSDPRGFTTILEGEIAEIRSSWGNLRYTIYNGHQGEFYKDIPEGAIASIDQKEELIKIAF